MLQSRKRLVTQYYDTIRAFKLKSSLWETQLSGDDTAHFPCLKSVRATGLNSDLNQYKDNRVVAGVQATVSDFWPTWDGLPSLLLAIHSKSLWSVRWLATWNTVIDLQCDSDLKTRFALASLDTFYQYLSPGHTKVTPLASKVLCMFGTTYLCEQVFSVINISAHTWSLKWHPENGCYTGFNTWYWYTSET